MARELRKFVPSLQYYYMGFYIHTCPKMRYKARIAPSYLLCPETYTFHPIERCLEKIEAMSACRLHPDPEAKDECYTDATDRVSDHVGVCIRSAIFYSYEHYLKFSQVIVLDEGSPTLYPIYLMRYDAVVEDDVKEFVRAVGKKGVESLLLLRSPMKRNVLW